MLTIFKWRKHLTSFTALFEDLDVPTCKIKGSKGASLSIRIFGIINNSYQL